jgi:hypothetical protein
MRRFVIPIALVLVALAAGLAHGEITQQGNLRLAFNGRLAPKKLPRSTLAPIKIQVRGAISTADGRRPPALRRIEFAFNRYGKVSTMGLPRCKAAELEGTTTKIARERCRPALVGKGSFRAFVEVAGRKPVPFDGIALAFNGTVNKKPAVLLHIYGSTPTSVAFVLPFLIHRVPKGEFGTVFIARPPKIASNVGYITELEVTLGRTYRYQGERRSFLSARCAAPAGLPGATFTLARGEFSFLNGQQMAMSLGDNCWVR